MTTWAENKVHHNMQRFSVILSNDQIDELVNLAQDISRETVENLRDAEEVVN